MKRLILLIVIAAVFLAGYSAPEAKDLYYKQLRDSTAFATVSSPDTIELIPHILPNSIGFLYVVINAYDVADTNIAPVFDFEQGFDGNYVELPFVKGTDNNTDSDGYGAFTSGGADECLYFTLQSVPGDIAYPQPLGHLVGSDVILIIDKNDANAGYYSVWVWYQRIYD